MKKFLVLLLIFTFSIQGFSQENKKTKIISHKWGNPTSMDMAFKFISADRKPRSLYVKIGDSYTPISATTSFSLGQTFSLPAEKKLNLYTMEIVDGTEVFSNAISVDIGDMRDFVLGLFEANGKLSYKVVDISLDKMPIGTVSVVNMQPFPVGVQAGKRNIVLRFYEYTTTNPSKTSGKYASLKLPVYSLQNPKLPKLLLNGDMEFKAGTERMVIYIFGVKERNPFAAYDEASSQIYTLSDKGLRQ